MNPVPATVTPLPVRVLRYPTPRAEVARARTREVMRRHLRSQRVELAVLCMIAFCVTFGASLTI